MVEKEIKFNWVDIQAGDHILVGRLYEPNVPAERIIVIHPATGIVQQYYQAFATWLARKRKAYVLTYDYCDFGLSRRKDVSIRHSLVSMADWGLIDQNAALSFAVRSHPQLPIWVIGHSLGGLMLRWHEYYSRVDRIITVASGPVHLSDHPLSYQPAALWFWYLGGPLLTKLLGHLPGTLSGLGADLPAKVYWQWRRWCTTRGFFEKDVGSVLPATDSQVFSGRFTAFALSDDVMVPPIAAKRIDDLYVGVQIDHKVIEPSHYGLEKVGHYKLFSSKNAALWPAVIA